MRLLLILLVLLGMEAKAGAASEPVIAAAPEWVEAVPIPEANPELRDRPFQTLLASGQSLYGPDRHDHYAEIAYQIQNVQGLQGLGNIVLPWQPDHSDLIIHKVRIIRAGDVIDLLADGRRFTVLRRENGLEAAMLDGVLTAVMQAEGLAVGDVLNVAFTVRHHPQTLPLRGENLLSLVHGNPIGRYHVRQIWPPDLPMRWRGTDLLAGARTRRTALGTELSLDLEDVEGPEPPAHAPPRYAQPAILQVTQYRSWSEIGQLLGPHYERARQLAPDSPLHAQIERIAALSPDPERRALAALRLVQDEVRYFALAMGDGNYIPASADQTWSRRYGDCKGKTALLLALLHGLGIEAEPIAVNAPSGDGLDSRLPQLVMFNHVIVRARIGGRSYWLDGARTGDSDLALLASSTLGWGLPLRTAGAELERLPYIPPPLPLTESHVVYDGSGGFGGPIPVRVERVLRGDFATAFRAALSQVGRDAFIRQLRETADLPGASDEIVSVDVRDEDETGAATITVEGRALMEWRSVPGSGVQRFSFDNSAITWSFDTDRSPGPYADAPFAFPIPLHVASTETVLLPNDGRGYAIEGNSFERTVAGTRLSRQLSLEGNRAVNRSTAIRLEPEVPAAEARRAVATLGQIQENSARLRAPHDAEVATAREAEGNVDPPPGAADLVDSGFDKLGRGLVREALEDFDRAVALAPNWARAHANRGVALGHLDRLDEAERALAEAARLNDRDFVVHQGYGNLYLRRNRPAEAVASLTRSLELEPDNGFTLGLRAHAHQLLGQYDRTLADLTRMMEVGPERAAVLMLRARLHAHLGRQSEALADADAAIADQPENFGLKIGRAELLEQFGRTDEAAQGYAAALAQLEAWNARASADQQSQFLETHGLLLVRAGRTREALDLMDARLRRFAGNTRTLALRCQLRAEANLELERALADCDEALEAEPDHRTAKFARGLTLLRMGRWADAERDFASLMNLNARDPDAPYGRALARQRRGDEAGSREDFELARRLLFYIDAEWGRRQLTTEAGTSARLPGPAQGADR